MMGLTDPYEIALLIAICGFALGGGVLLLMAFALAGWIHRVSICVVKSDSLEAKKVEEILDEDTDVGYHT